MERASGFTARKNRIHHTHTNFARFMEYHAKDFLHLPIHEANAALFKLARSEGLRVTYHTVELYFWKIRTGRPLTDKKKSAEDSAPFVPETPPEVSLQEPHKQTASMKKLVARGSIEEQALRYIKAVKLVPDSKLADEVILRVLSDNRALREENERLRAEIRALEGLKSG